MGMGSAPVHGYVIQWDAIKKLCPVQATMLEAVLEHDESDLDVHLSEILDGLDALNDYAEDVIVGSGAYVELEDISFQVVGGESNGNEYIGGTVKLRVQADIISYNDDDDWKEDEDE